MEISFKSCIFFIVSNFVNKGHFFLKGGQCVNLWLEIKNVVFNITFKKISGQLLDFSTFSMAWSNSEMSVLRILMSKASRMCFVLFLLSPYISLLATCGKLQYKYTLGEGSCL